MAEDTPAVRVRWPVPDDFAEPFEAAGGLQGRTGWPGVLAEHAPEDGRYTLVAECAGQIVGLAWARARPDDLHIEMLARNAVSQAARGERVGHALLKAASALAWGLALPFLTLESLDSPGVLAFYDGEGFVKDGPPTFDAAWGTLHPMRRSVASVPP